MSDEDIIARIKKGDETGIEHLYRYYQKEAIWFLKKLNCNEDDAKDIFQDTIFIFYEKVTQDRFVLISSIKIKTYLFSVCRNLWLKKLREQGKFTELEGIDLTNEEDTKEEEMILTTRQKIAEKCISKLGKTCKELIQYFYFDRLSMIY